MGAPHPRPAPAPRGRLGIAHPTEANVVELVSQGLTNRQIAERMFISPETVKTHVSHIFRKLDVHNRADLAARTVRRSTAG